MEWTEETISRLRGLWQQGLSTAEIGRRMGVTKNAVVGKAHRLTLPARPSPIHKPPAALSGETPTPRRETPRAPRRAAASEAIQAAAPAQVTGFVARTAAPQGDIPASQPAALAAATVTPLRPSKPPLREAVPETRRRGQTCCWPLGDPGTKQFRFCGAEPMQGKPYCDTHSQLAYVRLRDRRETVA